MWFVLYLSTCVWFVYIFCSYCNSLVSYTVIKLFFQNHNDSYSHMFGWRRMVSHVHSMWLYRSSFVITDVFLLVKSHYILCTQIWLWSPIFSFFFNLFPGKIAKYYYTFFFSSISSHTVEIWLNCIYVCFSSFILLVLLFVLFVHVRWLDRWLVPWNWSWRFVILLTPVLLNKYISWPMANLYRPVSRQHR